MNLLILIPLIILIVATVVVVVIMVRRIPQLRVLNVSESERERTKKVKENIILQRISRGGGAPAIKAGKAAQAVSTGLRRFGRRAVHKLKDLEDHYREIKEKGDVEKASPESLKRAMDEAADLVKEEEFGRAEKKYIEIISHNPKHSLAYEYLGRLYTKTKQYDQAEETLRHAEKLSPSDASLQASLGEVYMAREQWTKALAAFQKSVDKRPGNPKYLDNYIEAAIKAKNTRKAWNGLNLLKEANPENQKLADFEERIMAIEG